VKNTTAPESVLKKHHNAIAYHRAREAQAAGFIRVAWESGETNIADLLTKLMPGPRLKDLIGYVLWYPLGYIGYGIRGRCQHPIFLSFFLRPPTILARGWASVSGLCFGLILSLGMFWHTVTPGTSGSNMSGILCSYLQSARLTRQ
jgi:hypothetical protein